MEGHCSYWNAQTPCRPPNTWSVWTEVKSGSALVKVILTLLRSINKYKLTLILLILILNSCIYNIAFQICKYCAFEKKNCFPNTFQYLKPKGCILLGNCFLSQRLRKCLFHLFAEYFSLGSQIRPNSCMFNSLTKTSLSAANNNLSQDVRAHAAGFLRYYFMFFQWV